MVRGWRRFTWQVKHPTACNILAGHACKIPSRLYRIERATISSFSSSPSPRATTPSQTAASWGEPMWGGFGWVRLAFGVSPHQMDWPALGYAKYAHVGETVLGQVCPGTDRELTHTYTHTQLDRTVIRTRWRDRCLGIIIIIDRSGEGFRV